MLTINIYNFGDSGKTDRILTGIAEIKEIAMTLKQDFDALLAKVDEGTNKVAARIDALAGKIKNSMTDEEVADLKAKMGTESDRLEAMGKDPVNPVPDVPPVEPTA